MTHHERNESRQRSGTAIRKLQEKRCCICGIRNAKCETKICLISSSIENAASEIPILVAGGSASNGSVKFAKTLGEDFVGWLT